MATRIFQGKIAFLIGCILISFTGCNVLPEKSTPSEMAMEQSGSSSQETGNLTEEADEGATGIPSSSSGGDLDAPEEEQAVATDPPKETSGEDQRNETSPLLSPGVASTAPDVTDTPAPTPKEKRTGKQPAPDQVQSWYYMKQGKGKVPRFPVTAWFEPEQLVRWVGSGKTVYLTFDNGAGMGDLDKLLDVMHQHQVKASFFITGSNMLRNPKEIRKIVDAGHLVLNHSLTHRDFTTLSDEAILRELEETDKAYQAATGQVGLKYFRFPYGKFSSHILDLVAGQGYKTVFWSTALKDWVKRENGAIDAYNDVMNNLHDGNVILLHQASEENTEALDDIIRAILEQGYRFGLVDEL